mmetsp:Transcript_96771/g.269062  ORF Transcript_96771/g.269062 Transcript_96771/m.269062 type:complete len:217 (+) Transcript_96771:165-815(+)
MRARACIASLGGPHSKRRRRAFCQCRMLSTGMLEVAPILSSCMCFISLATITTLTAEANLLALSTFLASSMADSGSQPTFFFAPPAGGVEFSPQASTLPSVGSYGGSFLRLQLSHMGMTPRATTLMTCCQGQVPMPKPRQMSHCPNVSPSSLRPRAPEAMTRRLTIMIWSAKVAPETMRKSRLLRMPEKMLNSPRSFREFHSLKSCMSTKTLKMMV